MASFGNSIANLNKDIRYLGTAICARGEETGKLSPQFFATYADCSLDNGPFTRYIDMMEKLVQKWNTKLGIQGSHG